MLLRTNSLCAQPCSKHKPKPKPKQIQIKKLHKETITLPPKMEAPPAAAEEERPKIKFEVELGEENTSSAVLKKKKKKKKKKKATFGGSELEILQNAVGGSEAIPSHNPNRVDEDRMQLEDIVNDNENHYIQEHHTDIFHKPKP